MGHRISPSAHVDPKAEIGDDVTIGPFCLVGPNVIIGEGTQLDSHVTIIGQTTIGARNRFLPNCVIGGEPQDISYRRSNTGLEIGDGNIFREGVTVNIGAEKEDGCTRIGSGNMLMANCHVAHNCNIQKNVILVNGVLLGGHVHVHDGAIVSGNSVVHHFSTLGTLSFVSGGCRVPHDIPPYMLAAGSDDPTIKTVNIVGMRRAGICEQTIRIVKRAHRMLFREHKSLESVQDLLCGELEDTVPIELSKLFTFVKHQQEGRMGRGRERFRNAESNHSQPSSENASRRAA